MVMANDMTAATFDVVSEVGPSSSSKRAATVRALTGMLQITSDPETAQVLTAMAMMNMEGEGVSDANAYFRKKLLRMGVVKPTDIEAEELMAEMQGKPQDPNAMYLQAAAEEATAKAAKARADTVETVASAELKRRLLRAMECTFSHSSCLTFSGLREMSSKFFGRKSTAPASSASRVTRAPSWVSEENISTGVGQRCMMLRTAVMPSIIGIS